jgi:hypothetical protein
MKSAKIIGVVVCPDPGDRESRECQYDDPQGNDHSAIR